MSLVISIFADAAINSNGSYTAMIDPSPEITLFWNIDGAITGTSPTIQFSLQERDPSDDGVNNGVSASSTIINAISTGSLTLSAIHSNRILVSWTLGGISPSFASIDLVLISRDVITKSISNNSPVTTSVAALTSSTTLLSANSSRVGATIYNDSASSTLFLKLGITASTSNYSVQLIPGAYFEVPYGYVGEIDGIWNGTVGFARITELS
jgi:hypothetical protein